MGMVGLARKVLLRLLVAWMAPGMLPAEGLSSTQLTAELDASGLGVSEGEVQAELRHLAQRGVLDIVFTRGAEVRVTGIEPAALGRLLGTNMQLSAGSGSHSPVLTQA